MMTFIKQCLTRFRKDEDGSAAVEFVLYFSLVSFILFAAIEMAYMNLRHAMLERAVDISVRDIRLSTGDVPTYDAVRTSVCTDAAILANCETNLRLEMLEVDPRTFTGLDTTADCQNAEEEPRPKRAFDPGSDNALMLMRACLKYKPMMPTTGLAARLDLDDQGYAQMVVTAAFVQEPR